MSIIPAILQGEARTRFLQGMMASRKELSGRFAKTGIQRK
jgi:hypothetical protein